MNPIRRIVPALLTTGLVCLVPMAALSETPAPYEIRDGQVFIPGWDDAKSSALPELLHLKPEDFGKSVNVYRQRALLEKAPAVSSQFRIPPGTEELVLMGRSEPESDIFPRLRVTLELTERQTIRVLFEDYAQSRSMAGIRIPMPGDLAGQAARLRIEILNPSALNDIRLYYLAYASFRGPGKPESGAAGR